MSDLLKPIYAAFTPAPLHKGQDDLYVDLDSVRGDSSVIDRMKLKILLSDELDGLRVTLTESARKDP